MNRVAQRYKDVVCGCADAHRHRAAALYAIVDRLSEAFQAHGVTAAAADPPVAREMLAINGWSLNRHSFRLGAGPKNNVL
jgi:hypothetical protein